MSDSEKKDRSTTAEVSVNWEGLKRFLGWEGSINDLKKVELDQPIVEHVARRSSK